MLDRAEPQDTFTPVDTALIKAAIRSAGPKQLQKSKRRLWGLYAWRDNPSIINEAALSDAYLRHAALAAKASLGE